MENAKYILKPAGRSGFTLVELLIAVAMFSFVLLLVATVFIQINRTYTRGVNTKTVHEEARTALESLSRDFRTVSSSQQVSTECVNGNATCADNIATGKLCVDNNAYIFVPPDPGNGLAGELRLAENINCSSVSATSGTELFSQQVQPQFFKVNEIVPGKTYQVEMVISTGSFSSDLLDTSSSDPRDIGCDPSLPGNQFCRAIYLDTIVTLRNR